MKTRSEIAQSFEYNEADLQDAEDIDRLMQIQATGNRHGSLGWYPDGEFASDADWCYGVGADIRALEDALGIDDGAVFDLYSDAHSEALERHHDRDDQR